MAHCFKGITLSSFKFIDLFAGIGGFHLAMHSLGGKCVFASEIDPFARKTYEKNFKDISPELFEQQMFNDDIRAVSPSDIPDFDVLCGGFPCQPFSQAGHKRGFNDTHKSERGNLFFNIVDILAQKRPKAFFLENVRGIVNHDNGNTFKVIRDILEKELGYSFYFKVVKASDYGLPQLRPRAFMIGFRDDDAKKEFEFPKAIPLKFTMSDVWGGQCSREVGFTLRVGGRGSNINDRRNWDSYLVDGEVKKLMPEQGLKMQGFPDDFDFPVPMTQAMKQLGNSVAVDAVRECASALLNYLNGLQSFNPLEDKKQFNQQQWLNIYAIGQLLINKRLMLANSDLSMSASKLQVNQLATIGSQLSLNCSKAKEISYYDDKSQKKTTVKMVDLISKKQLVSSFLNIKGNQEPVFEVKDLSKIGDLLTLNDVAADLSEIELSVNKELEPELFSILSFVNTKPTLLNASGNTNFIFEVKGLSSNVLDEINSLKTKKTVKDRIKQIEALGGRFVFDRLEKESMQQNLEMIDQDMPNLMATMLLEYFRNDTKHISESFSKTISKITSDKVTASKSYDLLKQLLISKLMGFSSGKKWNGVINRQGVVVIKDSGELVGFHLSQREKLESFLMEYIKFDAPSATRHRYGKLISEKNGNLYFKLNLNLSF